MSAKRKLSLFITLVFILSILLSCFTVNADRIEYEPSSSKPYKDGEVIVRFKDDAQAHQMSTFASGKGLRLKNRL